MRFGQWGFFEMVPFFLIYLLFFFFLQIFFQNYSNYKHLELNTIQIDFSLLLF